ncbi:membrane lipoprotein lipid attachment site-containing protein [Bacillus sp. MRMR6]|uniref:membrane lipoprotein lipid attachment site-containing protein n=1 Tax=Bacillus sp. MRMR6 TaxID=1928617 RepID=UPI00095176B9|nr:membrane lipoprotein lipid attachment site-containing protein [Bacillus sp. MRMR6]OLS41219.1 hypothetical protein BTR25_04970 [Bacillus sp. MRMR6]
MKRYGIALTALFLLAGCQTNNEDSAYNITKTNPNFMANRQDAAYQVQHNNGSERNEADYNQNVINRNVVAEPNGGPGQNGTAFDIRRVTLGSHARTDSSQDMQGVRKLVNQTGHFRVDSIYVSEDTDHMVVTVHETRRHNTAEQYDELARLHAKLVQSLPHYTFDVRGR